MRLSQEERIEAVKQQVARARERGLMAALKVLSEAAPDAAESLVEISKQKRDLKSAYHAAAKILDFLSPRPSSPLVNINLGNFKSHLSLPAAPEVAPIEVTAAPPKSAVQIIKTELERRSRINPEAARHRDFMRQRFEVNEPLPEPEPETFKPQEPPAPQKLELKAQEQIPQATAFPESK
jgi:hypothetical protein